MTRVVFGAWDPILKLAKEKVGSKSGKLNVLKKSKRLDVERNYINRRKWRKLAKTNQSKITLLVFCISDNYKVMIIINSLSLNPILFNFDSIYNTAPAYPVRRQKTFPFPWSTKTGKRWKIEFSGPELSVPGKGRGGAKAKSTAVSPMEALRERAASPNGFESQSLSSMSCLTSPEAREIVWKSLFFCWSHFLIRQNTRFPCLTNHAFCLALQAVFNELIVRLWSYRWA
jgi:hypothetical protein